MHGELQPLPREPQARHPRHSVLHPFYVVFVTINVTTPLFPEVLSTHHPSPHILRHLKVHTTFARSCVLGLPDGQCPIGGPCTIPGRFRPAHLLRRLVLPHLQFVVDYVLASQPC